VGSFKNLFTNHKARKAQKFPEILQIQVCTTYGSLGLDVATMRKTIFTCVYFEKKSSPEPAGQFQSNLEQIILR
jgi:hypothetical protein